MLKRRLNAYIQKLFLSLLLLAHLIFSAKTAAQSATSWGRSQASVQTNDSSSWFNYVFKGGAYPTHTTVQQPSVIHLNNFTGLNNQTRRRLAAYTIQEWRNYFAELNKGVHPQLLNSAIFHQFNFYQFPVFRDYIATLPGYHEAIVFFHDRLAHDPMFAKQLASVSIGRRQNLKDFICKQVEHSKTVVAQQHEQYQRALQQAAITKQQQEIIAKQQQEMLAQQQAVALCEAQAIATIRSQQEDLAAIVGAVQSIEKPRTESEMKLVDHAKAIKAATHENFAYTTQKYQLVPSAQRLLNDVGINTNDFTQCHGTAIQHNIHNELVSNINRAAMIYTAHHHNSTVRQIAASAAEFAHIGVAYNNAGYVHEAFGVSQLTAALADYACAVAQGVKDGVTNVAHSIAHPIDTVTNITRAASTVAYFLGKVLYETADITGTYMVNPIAGTEKLTQCKQNIAAIYREIHEKYQSMTGPEMVRATTALATEAWLTGKCLGAAGKFYSRTHGKVIDFSQRVKAGFATAPELLASAEGLEVLIANEAAETVMLSSAENAASSSATRTVSSKLQTMHEPIAWHELDPTLGDLTKLQKSEELLKLIPTPDKLQHPLVTLIENGKSNATSGNLGTARGALYELQVAVELEAKGEKVLEFSRRVERIDNNLNKVVKEFDIITQTKLIECKDWNWEMIRDIKITKHKSTFQEQNLIAKHHNQTFELYSKQPIPDNWKAWFSKNNIIFHEGSK